VGADGKDLLNIYKNDKAPEDLDPMGEVNFDKTVGLTEVYPAELPNRNLEVSTISTVRPLFDNPIYQR
jgi:hypothetical protein